MGRDEIQGLCALHCKLASMEGIALDKPAMRFSALADYVEHIVACGEPRLKVSMPMVWEAIDTAVSGNPLNIPKTPFNRSLYLWMEV